MTSRKLRRTQARTILKAERRKKQTAALAATVVVGATVVLAMPADAAGPGMTIPVTSTADDGSAGTLRSAIERANAAAGPVTIDVNLGAGNTTIALAEPLPALTGTATITADEADGVTLDAGALDSEAAITVDPDASLTLCGLTIDSAFIAVASAGDLSVTDSTIVADDALGVAVFGGSADIEGSTVTAMTGIQAQTGVVGEIEHVDVSDSTITAGPSGSGVRADGSDGQPVDEVTISGSTIEGGAEGVSLSGPLSAATLENSTIYGARYDGLSVTGADVTIASSTIADDGAVGVSATSSSVRIENSMVAGSAGGDLGAGEGGSFTVDHSLIGVVLSGTGVDASTFTDSIHGSSGSTVDPQLGALADNGGPTQTMMPQAGSPVIDAGASSAATDQRGALRVAGTAADMGAVETQTGKASVSLEAPSGAVQAGRPATFTATIDFGDDAAAAQPGELRLYDGDQKVGSTRVGPGTNYTDASMQVPVVADDLTSGPGQSFTARFVSSAAPETDSDPSEAISVDVAAATTIVTPAPAPTPGPAPAPGPVPGVAPAPKKPKLLGAVVAGHKVHAVLPVVAGAPAGARTKIVWYVDGKKVGKGHKLKLKARWRGMKLTCTVTTTWGKGHHKHKVTKKSKAKRIKG